MLKRGTDKGIEVSEDPKRRWVVTFDSVKIPRAACHKFLTMQCVDAWSLYLQLQLLHNLFNSSCNLHDAV